MCHGGRWRGSGESRNRDSYRSWHHCFVRLSLFVLILKEIHTLLLNLRADGSFLGASQNIGGLMDLESAMPLSLNLRADSFLMPNVKDETRR